MRSEPAPWKASFRSFRDHVILLAAGVDAQGQKHVRALREGTTENATVCKALLADLRQRGLDLDRPMLFVIDGGTGLRKALRNTCGALAVVQRCQVHKRRNVPDCGGVAYEDLRHESRVELTPCA